MSALTAPEKHIVIAFCGSEKKHRQSFDKLRQYVEDQQKGGGVAGRNHMRFSFVEMRYETEQDRMSLDAGEEADVVLQKVSTLLPKAAEALKKWCTVTTHHRLRQGRPPVILIDPVDATQLVLARSLLLRLLDCHLRLPLCTTPRSWLCALDGRPAIPLGISPLSILDKDHVDAPRGRWWILKADLSTGPAYTHHMIVWRGDAPEKAPPEEVRRLVPAEVDTFVVQEFYADALPVVVKVYCIGARIWAKAVPTGAMTEYIHKTVNCGSHTAVFVDPQRHTRGDAGDTGEALCWERFLAEGGQAYERIARIAEELMKVLSLSLFGFDILLLPPGSECRGVACLVPGYVDGSADIPTQFFDDSGAPTSRLCKATPVVIDVNYFPGYGGMPNLHAQLIELIERTVIEEVPINSN